MALTKFNFNSFDVTTAASKGLAFNSSANGFETSTGGSMVLIKTLTASSSSTLSFVDGSSDVVLDNTYPVYLFKFINIHPASNDVNFNVNFRDGGSSYDATKTTTNFHAYHGEGAGDSSFGYSTGQDLAQSTSNLRISGNIGNENDESSSGELFLFNPSSTTFVKHFISNFQGSRYNEFSANWYVAGYCNVTAAIDGVRFKMDSGNIDSGTFKMYGVT